MSDHIHRLRRIQEAPYRYECVTCGQRLKIASGIVPPVPKCAGCGSKAQAKHKCDGTYWCNACSMRHEHGFGQNCLQGWTRA
jgi:hypothetical protein